jgi:hypothetical protein
MTVQVSQVTVNFTQPVDGEDDRRNGAQCLTVMVTHCGDGPYLVLTTDRWAMDYPDDLKVLLDEVARQTKLLFARNEA